jgi:hypothetical protein
MNDSSSSGPERTSARKAESNRRNAQKSTGPRTEQGKANSRLNALKHGILASNATIAVIEGREHRKEFEAMVDGLGADLQPVGTLEQLLVEDVAACFWKKRRLLRFETRTAFEARDRRIDALIREFDHPMLPMHPAYRFKSGKNLDFDDILDEAHLGFDLPDEDDLKCATRYEGTITRTLRLSLAELRGRQAERAQHAATNPSRYADRDVVIDKDAMELNAGPGHVGLGAKVSIFTRGLEDEREEAEHPELKESRETLIETMYRTIKEGRERDYQTKPNTPASTETSSREEHPDDASSGGDRAAEKPQE